MIQFSSNPILFKIKKLNGDVFDTATNISAVIGKAFHHAMEVYYSDEIEKEGDAIRLALEAGMNYMSKYEEGWINWSKTVPIRQKALDRVSYGITEYVKYANRNKEETVACEQMLTSKVDVEYKGQRLKLPVALKGQLDRITRDKKGRLLLRDYKTCTSFSNLEKIDGCKIIQAVTYYLLVYAAYGEAPYSFTYEEVKLTKNSKQYAGTPQVREYEIIYEQNELYFDFFFRFYQDMIRGLNGEMVYVPNVRTMFDNEVSIVAYIQRLDIAEEAAKLMKKHNVTTITELLKSEIQESSNMRKLLSTIQDQLQQAKSINYEDMNNEQKIQTKLLEHGIVLNFEKIVEGATVDLYRYAPSIGVKMSKLRQYADDIQQVLGAKSVRVLAPIPGTTLVGFEVPKKERRFLDKPKADGFNLAIGETVDGKERRLDIREAPHMLVAGSTGSGKSVFLHSIIQQLLTTDNVDMHLYDPKQVELVQYAEQVTEYLHDSQDISLGLAYLVDEMEKRYAIMAGKKVRNAKDAGFRYKVIIIDEFADIAGRSDAIEHIQRIAQKGRAAGIHIILATQRASTKIIAGDVKVNFNVKVVFRMAKAVDSMVMIDEAGAEQLLGKGDMLFSSDEGIERLQGYSA